MASRTKNYGNTKFSVDTIHAAFETFRSNLSKEEQNKLVERRLFIIFGGEEKDFGNEREAFYTEYQKDHVEEAILECGKKDNPDINFLVEYRGGNTFVKVSMGRIELADSVINVFESVFQDPIQGTDVESNKEDAEPYDPQDPINQLINGLYSDNPDERANSAGMLGDLGDERAIQPLASSLYNEKDENVRRKIIESLGKFSSPNAYSSLIYALKDKDNIARHLAVIALGEVGDRSVISDLRQMTGDPEEDIQNSARESIQKILDRGTETKTIQSEQVDASQFQEGAEGDILQDMVEEPIEPIDISSPTPLDDTVSEEFTVIAKTLADGESQIDLLDYDVYAKALADFISSAETQKPITIGIDAPWGMGKTTLMRFIQQELKDTFYTVWFNAWTFDKEESLWSALILETLEQIRNKFNPLQRFIFWFKLNRRRFDWNKFWGTLVKNVFSFLILAFLVYTVILVVLGIFWPKVTLDDIKNKVLAYPAKIGFLATFAFLYKFFKEVRELLAGPFKLNVDGFLKNPNYGEHVGFLNQLKEDFEILLELITDEGKKPLLVFVDDLDRCTPPNPAIIFEAINLILGAEHCVFIIGMDSQAVAGSIEAKYEDLVDHFEDSENQGGLSLGHRFIEKIVQINFKIPKSEDQSIQKFVEHNLGVQNKEDSVTKEEQILNVERLIEAEQRGDVRTLEDAVNQVVAKQSNLSPDILETAKENVRERSFKDSPEVIQAISEASNYLHANPRKIKRFINLFRLKTYLAKRRRLIEDGKIDLKTLSKVVVFEMQWPDIFQAYFTDQEFHGRLWNAASLRSLQVSVQLDNKDWESYNQKLAPLLTDPRISECINSSLLRRLILEDLHEDIKVLQPYYELI